jgi:2-polyprenyl-3-methyl-5-hydroxy-6-metoxy-1,4-benzoquinol methylase
MSSRSQYHEGIRPEVVKFIPGTYSKVLEIGCGEGNFSSHFNQQCEYWGVEPFQAAAGIASNKLFKVLAGTYEEVYEQLPDGYFDLIVCNDVIEHMVNYDAFFQTIKRKMKKDSFIMGSIPNVRFFGNLTELLIKKDWEYKDSGILDRTHLRFFTEKSIKRTFIEHKFIIEEFCGICGYSSTNLKKWLQICVLGGDTRFLQFGFRIKYAGTHN